MKFKESDIELMIRHNFTEHEMIYIKVARNELPARRKEFRIEVIDYMTDRSFQDITRKLAERGLINSPRNTSEIMDLTNAGWEIANATGKGDNWERWMSQNQHYKLDVLLRTGAIKARRIKNRTFYYCRAKRTTQNRVYL